MQSILLELIANTLLLTGGLIAVTAPVCVGWQRLQAAVVEIRPRLRSITPYILVLGAVLLLNKGTQKMVVELSWLFDYDLTSWIYQIEGNFVANLQAMVPAEGIVYFSFVYIIGYMYLLAFPAIAYLCLDDLRRLKQLLVAYCINYGVGVLCYTFFIAYGPRNRIPDIVSQPLYEFYPESIILTSAVNTNTNVFPSLHTSLAMTVLVFAVLTRDKFPLWTIISAILSTSIILATMVLGIHWFVDVVAGLVLAAIAVAASGPIVNWLDALVERQERVSNAIAKLAALRS